MSEVSANAGVPDGDGRSGPFERFRDSSTVLVTTYRKDGTPVPTPVNLALDGERGDRAFFRTTAATGKAKRLRADDRVLLTPCTRRGTPTGEPQSARAFLLDAEGGRQAVRALKRKHRVVHGLVLPIAHRLRPVDAVFFQVVPVADGS